jgi:sugar O-acyltransferase (sialic acid O-acetyltransferase NeuD family)
MSEAVVVWGATGHARVVREALAHSEARVIALFDNDPMVRSPFEEVPIFHGDEGFETWWVSRPPGQIGAVVAIGGHRGADRCAILRKLAVRGLPAVTIVHPTAFVARSARLGLGAQVLAQAAVCVDTSIGEGCIVNTAASVDHECVLGDGVHICPGARLAGCVVVEDFATVGTGAVILPRIRIGTRAHVGAGAVVTKDVPAGTVVVGSPARQLTRPTVRK